MSLNCSEFGIYIRRDSRRKQKHKLNAITCILSCSFVACMCLCPIYSAHFCLFTFTVSLRTLVHRHTHPERTPTKAILNSHALEMHKSVCIINVCMHTRSNKYSPIWFFFPHISFNVLFLSRHHCPTPRVLFSRFFFILASECFSFFIEAFRKNEMAKQEKDLARIATTTPIIIAIDFVTISFCYCSAIVVLVREGEGGNELKQTGKIMQTNTQIVMNGKGLNW